MKKILLLLVAFSVTGCITDNPNIIEADGMKPVYISEEENFVAMLEPRAFGTLGKIVYTDSYLLINERFRGIHIVDNSNPADPVKINFIQIPGNTDFTVKNGFLYANHGSDFKAFQFGLETTGLSLGFQLEETCVLPEFFANGEENTLAGLVPPDYSGFFECVDPDKGIVVNWEETRLIDPECRI